MKQLQEYFEYSRTERNGILVLALACVFVCLLPYFLGVFQESKKEQDFSRYATAIETFQQAISTTATKAIQRFDFNPNTATADDFQALGLSAKLAKTILNYRNKGGRFYKKEDFKKMYGLSSEQYDSLAPYLKLAKKGEAVSFNEKKDRKKADEFGGKAAEPIELFNFDPNLATRSELLSLGLSERAVNILLKYRTKGGTFYHPEDLRKIYGISQRDFERLLPYILIEKKDSKTVPVKETEIAKTKSETPLRLDINTATAEEWQQLRGIGPAFSKRIIKFRERLGGFIAIAQVAETYGLPDSTFQQITPHLVLQASAQKLRINQLNAEQLATHPYLSRKQAQVIVNYRIQHGAFQSSADLAKIHLIDAEWLDKISPYLEFGTD